MKNIGSIVEVNVSNVDGSALGLSVDPVVLQIRPKPKVQSQAVCNLPLVHQVEAGGMLPPERTQRVLSLTVVHYAQKKRGKSVAGTRVLRTGCLTVSHNQCIRG